MTNKNKADNLIEFTDNKLTAQVDKDLVNLNETVECHLHECQHHTKNVTHAEAVNAVKTLLAWTGDNPNRAGILETPERVVKAFGEWFSGYKTNPKEILNKYFDEVAGYQAPVMLKGIPFHSKCEHHLAPIIGKAHIAYIPNGRVVGISKLARVTEAFALRLQIQERLTAEIAECISQTLDATGVAVMIEAEHFCMTTRGVNTHDTNMITYHLTGVYQSDPLLRNEFMQFCTKSS